MALTLIFMLAEENYGLEIDAIQEIAENPPVHYVPQAEGVLLGAISLHSQVLSLVDLPQLLGFDGEQRDQRRIVLTAEYQSLALAVTRVQRIVKLDLTMLEPFSSDTSKKAVRGVIDVDGVRVNMLDMNEIFEQLRNLYYD